MFGPLIIYGPTHVSYDVDVGHVLVSDCEYTGLRHYNRIVGLP